ncbi:AI-2E family transporter [Gilvimarinus xylanilyticus]|uniref:AI-2E family transporter n=1 Tax=Gilvimarinus xylanilyticus TaxID=2944139 RepID=A0A9X2I618_9GAMM|nr:AI-2E family transporter [Gilvimarinus xylanilyticus]MCP8900097.1 AI-2E family transporter [Gilvimarinus xylanilyticus]
MNTQMEINNGADVESGHASKTLKILALLAGVYTLYFAQTLLVPVCVAGFIALFSSPIVRFLLIFKIPRPLGAVLVISALLVGVVYSLGLLADPASRWLQVVPQITERLSSEVAEPLKSLRGSVGAASSEGESIEQAVNSTFQGVFSVLAETTMLFAVQVGAIIVITYFFLVFGDELMRNTVRAQSSFARKKMTVVMFQAIQNDVSRYVLVISLINVGLGVATAAAMAALGVEDAMLWGALATILNFAPYVGPMLLVVILTGVGFIEFYEIFYVLSVPGAFLVLNFIECQFVTPTLLGHRFNMNPLLVVLWMFAWGWLWGAVGMLIAIPLLVCFRILATHLDLVGSWVKVLNGGFAPSHEASE